MSSGADSEIQLNPGVGGAQMRTRLVSGLAEGNVHQEVVTLADSSGNLLDAQITGMAQDGTEGATPPSIPGTGIRGWLRSIYDRLSNPLAVTGTFWQATQPVSGTVTTAAPPAGFILSGTGGATVTLTGNKQPVTVHGYANGADGTIVMGGQTVTVRSGYGWDWDPGTTLSFATIVFSAAMDWFVEWN